MKKIKLLTAISDKDAEEFVKQLELESSRLCNIEKHMYNCLKNFIHENTGLENGCVVCVQMIEGDDVNIENHFDDLSDYVPASTGSVVLEMLIDKDMVFSISFSDYLRFNNSFADASELEREFLEEDLKKAIKIGHLDDEEDVISFIPMFHAKECTQFLVLNEYWDGEEMELAGIKPVKLRRMDLNNEY